MLLALVLLIARITAGVCGAAPATDATHAVRTFHPAVLATIPFGPRPQDFPTRDEYPEDAVLGIAFAGPDGSINVFDNVRQNIKQLSPPRNGIRSVHIIACPEADFPCDGAETADGTLYLLTDAGSSTDRYRVWMLPPRDTSWACSPGFDDSERGWKRFSDKLVLPVYNAVEMAIAADSEVVLYDGDQLTDGGVTVAIRVGLLPPEKRIAHAPGSALPGGSAMRKGPAGPQFITRSGAVVDLLQRRASLIGADSAGRGYFEAARRGPTRDVGYLERFDTAGQMDASMQMPRRSGHREIQGRGRTFVCPDGTVVEIVEDVKGIRFIGWTVED